MSFQADELIAGESIELISHGIRNFLINGKISER